LRHRWHSPATLALTALLLTAWLGSLKAASDAPRTKFADLYDRAQACERKADWVEACRCYDDILHQSRTEAEARKGYQRCLRCYHLVRRHRDSSYRQVLTRLTPGQALDVYEQVLGTVAAAYVDRDKTKWTALFQQGTQELWLALGDVVFVQEHQADAAEGVIKAFREKLESWGAPKLANRGDAREQVLAVIQAGQQLGLAARPGWIVAVALEFAAGACNALDEYTLFLTPGSFPDPHALKNKPAGVGIEVAWNGERLEVSRVYRGSPAAEAGLRKQDRVLSVNDKPVNGMTADDVAMLLRGKSGEAVTVEVRSSDAAEPRLLTLTRRPVVVPSVDYELQTVMTDTGEMVPIGLVRINHFSDGTVQEVKEALASLQTGGMRVLILDLRGNPGGLFKASVKVAELFLGEGVVVISKSPFPEYNQPHRAQGGHALTVPMVVLIDGDTASAAEVLAGALKEHRRATLVGQTTFGKGSIQCVIPLDKPPLDKIPGGIRITVAKLYSPGKQPYSVVGISPDVTFTPEGDLIVAEARRLLLGMLKPMPMPPMPMGEPR
jgi:carboxyl-terminal processing protease